METKKLYTLERFLRETLKSIIDYCPKIISAAIILFIGIYAIRFINKLVKKIMVKRELDVTLSEFVIDLLTWILRGLLFVTVISKLGIETTSFVAILGAAGLAVGMSLQGSLSNFAGGMLIVMFKPFRVGDYIDAQGTSGTVSEIQIFVTKIITPNNQIVFIPNGNLSNGIITNYSILGMRRADISLSISYATNIKEAKDIIMEILQNNPMVLKTPEPTIKVKNLSDSGIILAIHPWAKIDDYAHATSQILEDCKTAFDEKGIVFQPYVREASVE